MRNIQKKNLKLYNGFYNLKVNNLKQLKAAAVTLKSRYDLAVLILSAQNYIWTLNDKKAAYLGPGVPPKIISASIDIDFDNESIDFSVNYPDFYKPNRYENYFFMSFEEILSYYGRRSKLTDLSEKISKRVLKNSLKNLGD